MANPLRRPKNAAACLVVGVHPVVMGQSHGGPTAATEVPEHGSRLHRGELVRVPQKHQAGAGPEGGEDPLHQEEIHHGGLVDYDQVVIQGMIPVMAEAAGPGREPEEAVQGGGVGRLR